MARSGGTGAGDGSITLSKRSCSNAALDKRSALRAYGYLILRRSVTADGHSSLILVYGSTMPRCSSRVPQPARQYAASGGESQGFSGKSDKKEKGRRALDLPAPGPNKEIKISLSGSWPRPGMMKHQSIEVVHRPLVGCGQPCGLDHAGR